jgi:peptidoglycan hydrolase-like protein with peptidoglycan-binding domain
MSRTGQGATRQPLGGRAFLEGLRGSNGAAREAAFMGAIHAGNIPDSLRGLRPVTITDPRNSTVSITIYVTPDYLRVGRDGDSAIIPLGANGSYTAAAGFNGIIPTPHMVDAIYRSGRRVDAEPMTPDGRMTSTGYLIDQIGTTDAALARRGASLGALVGGHRKDVVVNDRLETRPTRVAIYGWHGTNGQPLEPGNTAHREDYVDYSHGTRIVHGVVRVTTGDEVTYRSIHDVLQDRRYAHILTGDGTLNAARIMARAPGVTEDALRDNATAAAQAAQAAHLAGVPYAPTLTQLPPAMLIATPALQRQHDSGDSLAVNSRERDAVRELQSLLTLHGHGLTADGSFGPLTRDAVSGFQRQRGLPETGVADTATLAALLDRQRPAPEPAPVVAVAAAEAAPEPEPAPQPAPAIAAAAAIPPLTPAAAIIPAAAPEPAPEAAQATAIDRLQQHIEGGALLRRRSDGDAVRELQTFLNAQGITDAQGRPLQLDGRFGQRTEEAIRRFQREQGLQVDGMVGRATLAAIQALQAPTIAPEPEPQAAPATAIDRLQQHIEGGALLRRRSNGDAVRELQTFLHAQGITDARGRPLQLDGRFGQRTEEAVRRFQREQGLQVDGVVGRATLAAIQALQAPTIAPAPAQEPTLVADAIPPAHEPAAPARLTDGLPAHIEAALRFNGFSVSDRTAPMERPVVVAAAPDPQEPAIAARLATDGIGATAPLIIPPAPAVARPSQIPGVYPDAPAEWAGRTLPMDVSQLNFNSQGLALVYAPTGRGTGRNAPFEAQLLAVNRNGVIVNSFTTINARGANDQATNQVIPGYFTDYEPENPDINAHYRLDAMTIRRTRFGVRQNHWFDSGGLTWLVNTHDPHPTRRGIQMHPTSLASTAGCPGFSPEEAERFRVFWTSVAGVAPTQSGSRAFTSMAIIRQGILERSTVRPIETQIEVAQLPANTAAEWQSVFDVRQNPFTGLHGQLRFSGDVTTGEPQRPDAEGDGQPPRLATGAGEPLQGCTATEADAAEDPEHGLRGCPPPQTAGVGVTRVGYPS